MKYIIILMLLAFNCHAELDRINSVAGSKYSVVIAEEEVSTHSTQHKAIQSAIKRLESTCTGTCRAKVVQNLELVIVVKIPKEEVPELPQEPEQVEYRLTWNIPTEREDGTLLNISEISHYELEVNGEVLYTIPPSETNTQITLETGVNKLRIRTVAGVTGKFSEYLIVGG